MTLRTTSTFILLLFMLLMATSSQATCTRDAADAIIVEEDEWNFEPVKLYEPPKLDFSRKTSNNWE